MKQTERSELTRKKILAAALSEFGSRGYAGVMINEICCEGKINKGLFYQKRQSTTSICQNGRG